jgi:transcriptional regulator GlxA family with amidase domain
MPSIPDFLPTSMSRPRLLLFVAFPGMGLLDMTGPQTVFWAATRYMEALGLPGYVQQTVSLGGGLVRAAEGVALETSPISDFTSREVDTLIVPGAPEIEQALEESADLTRWLSEMSPRVRRTASVCSGTFLLAQAGLLEGKRAATHWAMCDRLVRRFPTIEVDRDAIFVQAGPVWTSAGVTAGIDLSLSLVEADCGREIAMKVARELVVFLKRPGGQAQFSEVLRSQAEDDAGFDELHQWIAEHLGREDLTVDLLAERVGMSARNFARVYKQKTGRTPAKAVELFRLEAARRLLEASERNVDQIARQCGFGSEERMRMTFQRHLAVSPSEYRQRFSR